MATTPSTRKTPPRNPNKAAKGGAKNGPKSGRKSASAGQNPDPTVVSTNTPVLAEADLKKRELVDLVVERSGVAKKDVKPVVEAALAVLGETIAKGRELNLQPLGKLRINRSEEKANGRVTVCKLRQSKATIEGPQTPSDPLAEAAE